MKWELQRLFRRLLTITLICASPFAWRVGAQTLLNVDFGGGDSTSEAGPAATGHTASDFWNYYTRNDGHGGWLSLGYLSNLKTAEGATTGAGLNIGNAPGSWGLGSDDNMYDSYDYPFDGGNVTVNVTNLTSGAYDFYVYGVDANYELLVNGLSYGVKALPGVAAVNPVVWQEGLQYVLFRAATVTNGSVVTLIVRPGAGGYATIAGIQIAEVDATNHPPTANAQSVLVNQDVSKPITLTGSDLDGDSLNYSVLSQPAHGTLGGVAPALTYTPDSGYTGPDSFTFSVNDGHSDSAPATVNISVIAASTPELIDVDFGGGSSTTEVGPAATGHGGNDFWNYYTRNDGYGGWTTFGALSGLKNVEGATTGVGLTVANAPGAWGLGSDDDMYNSYIYPFDGGNVTVTVTNLPGGAYDFYVYGVDASYELMVNGSSSGIRRLPGVTAVNPVVWQQGLQYVLFRSVAVANSNAIVTLTVRPGTGGYATIAGLQIARGDATNHPPVANNQSVVVPHDAAKLITLGGLDVDGDPLAFTVVTQPNHGTLNGSAPTVTYTPTNGYAGPDSFTFRANDGHVDSSAATVSITVAQAGSQNLLNVDFGAGTATTKTGFAATGHATNDFWNFYTRDDGQGGWRTFGYLSYLKTAEGMTTAAGFSIANAPGAWGNGSSDPMYESYIYPFDGGNVTITITNLDAGAYDFSVYGIDATYEVAVSGQSYGTKPVASVTGGNPVVWQENLQYVLFRSVSVSAGATVTLTARPGSGGYATISGMQIAGVTSANHAPLANNQSVLVGQDSFKDITLTGSDVDGDSLTFAVVNPPGHGTLSGTSPNLTYTPSPGYSGPDSFTFVANDGTADAAPATVSIYVFPNNTLSLIDVDFGGGDHTAEVGPAATGHTASDFWNYYTRNDGQGGWQTFGVLSDLKTVEGSSTAVGLTVANAPGAWGNGSADDMLNSYIYPFDGGNVTVTVTNLDSGAYDFYVYGGDSSYELTVNGLSYGTKSLPNTPAVNPVVWQQGLQYVLFHAVQITNGDAVTVTVSPGVGGYATIAGMQIGLNPALTNAARQALVVPPMFAPSVTTLPASAITAGGVVLNGSINPHGAPTTVWFAWGTNLDCENVTASQSLGTVSSNITVSAVLAGLTAGQTYFFRARAQSAVGPSAGSDLSFAWSAARPALQAPVRTSSGISLRFSANAGQTYLVQASSDLKTWSIIGTANDLGNGLFGFEDMAGLRSRCYRLAAP